MYYHSRLDSALHFHWGIRTFWKLCVDPEWYERRWLAGSILSRRNWRSGERTLFSVMSDTSVPQQLVSLITREYEALWNAVSEWNCHSKYLCHGPLKWLPTEAASSLAWHPSRCGEKLWLFWKLLWMPTLNLTDLPEHFCFFLIEWRFYVTFSEGVLMKSQMSSLSHFTLGKILIL